jgi:hypothetical protein
MLEALAEDWQRNQMARSSMGRRAVVWTLF